MTLLRNEGAWYKHRWPWILIAGPATVIVAGVITVWLAVVSNDGLVTDDYYKQGLAVNQSLQRDKLATDLGVVAQLMRSDLNIRLVLTTESEAVFPSSLLLRLSHPTRAGQDQVVRLEREAPGIYRGRLVEGISGRWRTSIEDPVAGWRLQGDWMSDSDLSQVFSTNVSK